MHSTNKAVVLKQLSHFTPFCSALCIPLRFTHRTGRKRQKQLKQGERRQSERTCGPRRPGRGPAPGLTCVDGTRVMVAAGAAFVVAAQGGACLLAVGTFLKGKEKSDVSAPQTRPSPSRLSPDPTGQTSHVSLWSQEEWSTSNCHSLATKGGDPEVRIQGGPQNCSQTNPTEQGWGRRPAPGLSAVPPGKCLRILSSHSRLISNCLQTPPLYFCCCKSRQKRRVR